MCFKNLFFKKVLVIREKVGFKFGDFSFTRKYTSKIKSSKIVQTKKIYASTYMASRNDYESSTESVTTKKT